MRYLLILGAVGLLAAKAARAQPAASQLSCSIQPTKAVYRQGEPISLAVQLWNNSAVPQVLAVAVDGSEVGWRCPTVEFSVYKLGRNNTKSSVKPPAYARCGNTDAMTAEDFVEVLPGKMMDPCRASRYNDMSEWFRYQNLRPGEYEVVFTYSTVPAANYAWHIGADSQNSSLSMLELKRLQALIDKVPAITLRSSPVHLTITK